MISSAYLISRVWGLTGLISFTMIENNKGPSTVPWGTPLLTLRKLVTSPSFTTLCRRSHRKLIIQFLMYGLISKKREWNNCFIKFVKLQKFEVRNTSEKSEKIRAKSKKNLMKMRCCVTPCGPTDVGSSQKTFLAFAYF